MKSNTRKNIVVVSGSRADYGLLRWVIDGVKKSDYLNLKLIATGMHLSPEFGLTINSIKKDGYDIYKNVECLLSSDSSSSIGKSIGLGIIGFSDAFSEINPDLIILLGDRFEIFAAATAAMVSKIPIAHLHGGETTEAAIDEAIRHSITKMSHLHFVASKKYKQRVTQLGENPKMIFNVGGLGIDNILKIKLIEKYDLEKKLDFKFGKKNILVTFHPVTLEDETSASQMRELLSSLSILKETKIIFTMPNADADGRIIIDLIKDFCKNNPHSKFYKSLGQEKYLSCINQVDFVIGNSSSGIIEVPTFKKGTINIGDRQKGRLQAKSIVNCRPIKEDITQAIKLIYTKEFQESLSKVKNPYGNGGASEKIIKVIEEIKLNSILKKKFYEFSKKF